MKELNYSKYISGTSENLKKWQPPVPEFLMAENSAKLPISARVYPELLMALYVYFEEEHKMSAKSLGEIAYWGLCEALNLAQVAELPPPEVAAEFLLRKGFISAETKDIRSPLGKLFNTAQEKESQAYEGNNPQYWKHRDPEKYEAMISDATMKAAEELSKSLDQD